MSQRCHPKPTLRDLTVAAAEVTRTRLTTTAGKSTPPPNNSSIELNSDDAVTVDEIQEDHTQETSSYEDFDPNQPVPGVFVAPTPPAQPTRPAVSHTTYPTGPPTPEPKALDSCQGIFCVDDKCPCDPGKRS